MTSKLATIAAMIGDLSPEERQDLYNGCDVFRRLPKGVSAARRGRPPQIKITARTYKPATKAVAGPPWSSLPRGVPPSVDGRELANHDHERYARLRAAGRNNSFAMRAIGFAQTNSAVKKRPDVIRRIGELAAVPADKLVLV